MDKLKELKAKWLALWGKTKPARDKVKKVFRKIGKVMRKIGKVFYQIGKWIYHLRGVFMSVPVGIAAVWLAVQNTANLPEQVGINLLANGQYEYVIDRSVAVLCPLAVTAVCLLLMLCSRRMTYPWLISIFSLVVPVLLWVTNVFPA